MKKANVKKEIEDDLYLYADIDTVLRGSLKDVANNILALEDRLKKEHAMVMQNPQQYICFNIKVEKEYGSIEIKLSGIRMETDIEFEKRIERNKKAVEAQKASTKKRLENNKKRELAILICLQKKYANKKL